MLEWALKSEQRQKTKLKQKPCLHRRLCCNLGHFTECTSVVSLGTRRWWPALLVMSSYAFYLIDLCFLSRPASCISKWQMQICDPCCLTMQHIKCRTTALTSVLFFFLGCWCQKCHLKKNKAQWFYKMPIKRIVLKLGELCVWLCVCAQKTERVF